MRCIFIFLILAVSTFNIHAQLGNKSFTVIPLGVKGGLDESNLSSYMISAKQSNQYVCVDAGTVYTGIAKAINKKLLPQITPDSAMRKYIRGYLISHAHLDHTAGLVINSPNDAAKNIYAMPYTLDVLKSNYFTWESWANFADEGEKPLLNKYHYTSLEEGKEIAVEGTDLFVTPYILSHASPYKSTAFLLRSDSSYLLYLGDTGADSVEKKDNLFQLWTAVAPLILKHQLKAIFIEVSYANTQPVKQLFGHLTPHLLMQEMHVLNKLCGNEAMNNLKVVITHIKPSANSISNIKQQLSASNDLKMHFIFAQQAVALHF